MSTPVPPGTIKLPKVPIKLPPPALETWLAANPRVRYNLVWERALSKPPFSVAVRYEEWTAAEKQRLADAFALAWYGKLPVDGALPANLSPPPPDEYPRTVLSPEDAAALYFETAAACLAFDAQLPADSPRRLQLQDGPTRSHCIDSRSLFGYVSYYYGYKLVERLLPARPGYVLSWLAGLGLPGQLSVREAIAAVVGDCGRFFHMAGSPNAGNYQAHWHYPGGAPMVRMIEKTVPDPIPDNTNPSPEPRHYTAGCFGTAAFLEHALRPLNIRATSVLVDGHTLPWFPQVGLSLSHGDDPYPLKNHPEIAPDLLLIDQAQFAAWFGPDVPDATKAANVGRRRLELFGG